MGSFSESFSWQIKQKYDEKPNSTKEVFNCSRSPSDRPNASWTDQMIVLGGYLKTSSGLRLCLLAVGGSGGGSAGAEHGATGWAGEGGVWRHLQHSGWERHLSLFREAWNDAEITKLLYPGFSCFGGYGINILRWWCGIMSVFIHSVVFSETCLVKLISQLMMNINC